MKKAITITLVALLLTQAVMFGTCIFGLQAFGGDPAKAMYHKRSIMFRETPAYHNIPSL